jgi:hypothetical protein
MAQKYNNRIVQGDTAGVWLVFHDTDGNGTPAPLTGDYSCRIAVKGKPINRLVTDKNAENTKFLAFLTPTETDTLEVGTHLVGLQIVNTALVPPLRREIQIELQVVAQVVPNA